MIEDLVWITNPQLTASHDHQIPRAALGTWLGSGWQERGEQPAAAEEHVVDLEPAPSPTPRGRTTKTPADSGPDTDNTKGEV